MEAHVLIAPLRLGFKQMTSLHLFPLSLPEGGSLGAGVERVQVNPILSFPPASLADFPE